MNYKIETKTEEDTGKLAKFMGKIVKAGFVITLSGDLGAGKTTFAKGFARGMGVEDVVTSPTFTIVNEYEGKYFALYHFDVYRLDDASELEEIGYEEYFYSSQAVTLIEWPERVKELIPDEHLRVKIDLVDNGSSRVIEISAIGEKYEELIGELKKSVSIGN
ncbi:tRNA threonylcarbamoyladenosine biosynthesis protein TsaE [Desulfitispora alkaliphila]|uniref:tRNA (adenosine(37)-N6)-threonylcarbamoyltransferase complex ATPase subunit type 1 TsaE n=1 Tax=Desulfitispora alkaliphila TaxID=622674 RepID=UPI003D1E5F5F